MDIEGYETAVFEGMDELLGAESDLLVFVELYPHRVTPDEHTRSSLDSSKTGSRAHDS